VNHFKLLPCGRIIFYNSKVPPTPIASLPELQCQDKGRLSHAEAQAIAPENPAVHLGLSNVAISDKSLKGVSRARRGQRGITPHGRNSIRAGCWWLEDRFGKKNLTFLTVTLPDAAMLACTPATWSLLVNQFMKKIRYHLKAKGLSDEVVGCIEIQEERLKNTNGVPPLHLHLLFQGRQNYKHWEMGKKFYQYLWSSTCRSVLKVEAEFDQSCRVESIKKSGSAYMSKYLSKGGKVLDKCNPDLLPTAWYTLSSELKEIIKNTIITCNSHLAEQFYEYIYNGELLSWSRDVCSVEHGNGSRYLIAKVAQIKRRSKYWEIKDALDFLICRNTEIHSTLYKFEF